MSEGRNALNLTPNANATSIRALAFACAGSVLAFTAFLAGFIFDLASGPHFSLLYLFGLMLFGSLSADWLGRLVRIAKLGMRLRTH